MTTYIFDSIINNDILSLYLIKDFNTFIININQNFNNDEINNNINNNNNNYGQNYYIINNMHNEQCLFERIPCNISIMNVFEGISNGDYQLRTVEEFRQNNYHHNILDNIIWINILGNIAIN